MNEKIDKLLAEFSPTWGYRDLEVAIQTYEKAGKDLYELAEDIKQYFDEVFIDRARDNIDELDVVAIAYDCLHQEARTDIEQATGKDICNDKPYYGVDIASNYMCTSFDGKEEDMKALRELIETIPKEDRTKATVWLYEECEV